MVALPENVLSLPRIGRRDRRSPFFDIGKNEVRKLLRRAAERIRPLLLQGRLNLLKV